MVQFNFYITVSNMDCVTNSPHPPTPHYLNVSTFLLAMFMGVLTAHV